VIPTSEGDILDAPKKHYPLCVPFGYFMGQPCRREQKEEKVMMRLCKHYTPLWAFDAQHP
jgi:hypothetical protein